MLTQTCCSLKSSALFKLAISGISTLAFNCALGIPFMNFYIMRKKIESLAVNPGLLP